MLVFDRQRYFIVPRSWDPRKICEFLTKNKCKFNDDDRIAGCEWNGILNSIKFHPRIGLALTANPEILLWHNKIALSLNECPVNSSNADDDDDIFSYQKPVADSTRRYQTFLQFTQWIGVIGGGESKKKGTELWSRIDRHSRDERDWLFITSHD